MLYFAKILQCCFTATLGRSEEEEGGGTGGEGGGLLSAPSPLTHIVPNSASIYSVFHSVNYISVGNIYRANISFPAPSLCQFCQNVQLVSIGESNSLGYYCVSCSQLMAILSKCTASIHR